MSKNNKYIFKYNQDDELYNYVELNKSEKILSYFKIENNTLTRFDRQTDVKQLITFKQKVELRQKFMGGESFITVFDVKNDECIQYKMSEIEKQITLVKNNITVSDFGKFVVKKWKHNLSSEEKALKPFCVTVSHDSLYEKYWSNIQLKLP
jgi:hypothetical protein